jgi:carboxyl-terminal processing protease
MTSRTRWIVLLVSTPLVAFVVIGGLLGRTFAKEGTYPHLRIFEDVVSLIAGNYVEEVEVDKVMSGAMRGLAEGLDADSAWLTPEQAKAAESDAAVSGTLSSSVGTPGLELTRGYYLRVIAARDESSAAKAGLQTGDYIRAIDGKPTRSISALEGMRLLRGPVGSKVALTVLRGSATDPREVTLVREAAPRNDVSGRLQAPGVGYVRIAAFGAGVQTRLESQIAALAKAGATKLVLDLRGTAQGSLDEGVRAARLFVPSGTLASRETRAGKDVVASAAAGDGKVTAPVVMLTTTGTSGAAEVFAAALVDNKRGTLVGEHTLGRAGLQKLVKLPDGSALWMTWARYVSPSGTTIHGTGLEPVVEVEQPDVEFGDTPPTNDPILEKALEQFTSPAKKAA